MSSLPPAGFIHNVDHTFEELLPWPSWTVPPACMGTPSIVVIIIVIRMLLIKK